MLVGDANFGNPTSSR